MMWLKEQVANLITLLNLVCGVWAIFLLLNISYYGHEKALLFACILVLVGALFDLMDGLVARALKISSEIGKQLDSLSDMVTFGVVPGIIALILVSSYDDDSLTPSKLISVLIPVFSAVRLAKFNIDARQSKNFIGLPTPANALFWVALGLISLQKDGIFTFGFSIATPISSFIDNFSNNLVFLMSCIICSSLLLVSPIRLFGFKFDKLSFYGNEMKLSFLITSIFLILILGFTAIPLILLLYILFSIIHFYILKRDEVQS